MNAYGETPILQTNYVAPAAATPIADFAAAEGSGSGLGAGDYDYRIASVTVYGEQEATAATGAVTLAGDSSIDLTWTADSNAVAYMIFRQDGGSGDYALIDIIPALTYDSAGTVNGSVESYEDTGAKSRITQVVPLETDEQNILLVNRNPNRGAAILGLVDDMGRPQDTLFRYVELARTKDTYDYMLKGYQALRLVHPNLVAMVRNVKVS
jgi:hypothetical protein